MTSFVVFSVLGQLYGVDIKHVKRILPSQSLTDIPDEGVHIEGMFQYEDDVIKVLSFREAIGERSYEEQLKEMFPELKDELSNWLEALKKSVETGKPFKESTDAHNCHLGKWIDSFHPDDEEIIVLMKKLSYHHQNLHHSASDVLAKREHSVEEARECISEEVSEMYKNTLHYLDKVSVLSSKVAADLQRCLIIEDKDGSSFALNIDAVDDIVHIDENELHVTQNEQKMGDFMNVSAILSHDKGLVTIIKDITLEKRGA